MTREVMLDLETMGTGNNAAIVSIGATLFDTQRYELVGNFYCNVNLTSCLEIGLEVSGSTIMWWLQQSEEARKALTGAQHSVKEALTRFADWSGNRPIWGNASTFDNIILRNAYEKAGIPCPWHYSNDRCYRTLKNMFPNVPKPPDNTEKHNALTDARWQAEHLINILKEIRK